MMNLNNFLSDNICPICSKSLTLYMQWSSLDTFLAHKKGEDYYFDRSVPILNISENNYYPSPRIDKNNKIFMTLDRDLNIKFNSLSAENFARKQDDFFFFYLCNPEGLKLNNDFSINIYEGCYFRSGPFCNFNLNNDKLSIKKINENSSDIGKESFSFKVRELDLEKVFILNMNYENSTTTLYYYSVKDEDLEKENFTPNMFEKTMDLLKVRPNFNLEDRDKLIERLNSWIILS